MEMKLGGLGQLGALGLPILGGQVLKKLSRMLPFHTTLTFTPDEELCSKRCVLLLTTYKVVFIKN